MRPVTMRWSRRRAGALAASAIGLLATSASASAAGVSVIVKVRQASGLVSPYFRLQSRPGLGTKAGSLLLLNPTGRTVIVRVDPVSGLTTDTLGSAYALRGGATHGPAAWLKLSPRRVTIGPHSRAQIHVSLTAPASTTPGDYLSGIAVEALGQDSPVARPTGRKPGVPSGISLGETYRYAIGVELSLPGPRHPSVELTGARVSRDPAGVVFRIGARNNGNVILKNVTGQVVVTRNGRLVARSSIAPGTFVTNTSIQFPVPAHHQQPQAGTAYRVQASISYAGGTAHVDRTVTFDDAAAKVQQSYGGPRVASHHKVTWLYIAAPAALALIFLLGFVWRNFRRPPRRAAALAFLQRELAVATPGVRQLSVIHLEVPNPSRASRRRIVHALRHALRRSDFVYDLDRDGLLIALPHTGPATAGELAAEIREVLKTEDVQSVGTPTSTDGIDPHQLITKAQERLLVEDDGVPVPA
jgi:hypothetical protein